MNILRPATIATPAFIVALALPFISSAASSPLCNPSSDEAQTVQRRQVIADLDSANYLTVYRLPNEKFAFTFHKVHQDTGVSCQPLGRHSGYTSDELNQAEATLQYDARLQKYTNYAIIGTATVISIAVGGIYNTPRFEKLIANADVHTQAAAAVALAPASFGYTYGGLLLGDSALALATHANASMRVFNLASLAYPLGAVAGSAAVGAAEGYAIVLLKDNVIGQDEQKLFEKVKATFAQIQTQSQDERIVIEDLRLVVMGLQQQLMNVGAAK